MSSLLSTWRRQGRVETESSRRSNQMIILDEPLVIARTRVGADRPCSTARSVTLSLKCLSGQGGGRRCRVANPSGQSTRTDAGSEPSNRNDQRFNRVELETLHLSAADVIRGRRGLVWRDRRPVPRPSLGATPNRGEEGGVVSLTYSTPRVWQREQAVDQDRPEAL